MTCYTSRLIFISRAISRFMCSRNLAASFSQVRAISRFSLYVLVGLYALAQVLGHLRLVQELLQLRTCASTSVLVHLRTATFLHTCLLAQVLAHLRTCASTCAQVHLRTYAITKVLSEALAHLLNYLLTCALAHSCIFLHLCTCAKCHITS